MKRVLNICLRCRHSDFDSSDPLLCYAAGLPHECEEMRGEGGQCGANARLFVDTIDWEGDDDEPAS